MIRCGPHKLWFDEFCEECRKEALADPKMAEIITPKLPMLIGWAIARVVDFALLLLVIAGAIIFLIVREQHIWAR